MRYTGLTTLFAFTFGAFLMATTAGPIDGQEKVPSGFKEFVTVKVLDPADGSKVLHTQDGVPGYQQSNNKNTIWVLKAPSIVTDISVKSVAITAKDGKVYKSTKVTRQAGTYYAYYDAAP